VKLDTISSRTTTDIMTEEECGSDLVNTVLDENLLHLYSNEIKEKGDGAEESSLKYLINLELRPLQYRLEHAFLVAMLTRDDVIENPKLRGAVSRIEKEYADTQSVSRMREMTEKLAGKYLQLV